MIAVFVEERRREIVAILGRDGRCQVRQLARTLDVSEVTIRQDLAALEEQGALRRTHGGALPVARGAQERPFQVEETTRRAEKARIAEAAVERLGDARTVILDVGTTVTEAARRLVGRGKVRTAITNGLNIASLLEQDPDVTTVVIGGTLRAQQHSLVNPYANLVLERIHADVLLLGANGIEAERGVTNVNVAEAEVKALFLKKAERRILLADSSKVGRVALAKVAGIEEIDTLITDRGADRREVARLRERGLEVVLV